MRSSRFRSMLRLRLRGPLSALSSALLPVLVSALVSVLVSACGGGNGSGSGSRSATPFVPFPDPVTPVALYSIPDPDLVDFNVEKGKFETDEYRVEYMVCENPVTPTSCAGPRVQRTDTHLNLINAAAAYARGATGAGETVVIFDSGLFSEHQEFNGKEIRESSLPSSFTPNHDQADHGTAVAATAVGVRDGRAGVNMHGVAYDANLQFINWEVLSGPGRPEYIPLDLDRITPADDTDFARVYGYGITTTSGFVINHSFGVAGGISRYDLDEVQRRFPKTAEALAQADVDDADKQIIVWAAGNAGTSTAVYEDDDGTTIREPARADSPELFAGLGVAFPELRSHVLAVVALDQGGGIASYSNRCGLAKSFCLAAPGSAIVAAFSGNAKKMSTVLGLVLLSQLPWSVVR